MNRERVKQPWRTPPAGEHINRRPWLCRFVGHRPHGVWEGPYPIQCIGPSGCYRTQKTGEDFCHRCGARLA